MRWFHDDVKTSKTNVSIQHQPQKHRELSFRMEKFPRLKQTAAVEVPFSRQPMVLNTSIPGRLFLVDPFLPNSVTIPNNTFAHPRNSEHPRTTAA